MKLKRDIKVFEWLGSRIQKFFTEAQNCSWSLHLQNAFPSLCFCALHELKYTASRRELLTKFDVHDTNFQLCVCVIPRFSALNTLFCTHFPSDSLPQRDKHAFRSKFLVLIRFLCPVLLLSAICDCSITLRRPCLLVSTLVVSANVSGRNVHVFTGLVRDYEIIMKAGIHVLWVAGGWSGNVVHVFTLIVNIFAPVKIFNLYLPFGIGLKNSIMRYGTK